MNLERVTYLKEIIESNRLEIDLETGLIKTYKGVMRSINSDGYITTSLKCSDGKMRCYKAHQIIAVAGGLDIVDKVINHKDGCKTNNKLSNLEAVTIAENYKHARETGLLKNFQKGKEASNSKKKQTKLTEEQVAEMRSMFGKVKQGDIAKQFGVSEALVSMIKSGKKKGWLL